MGNTAVVQWIREREELRRETRREELLAFAESCQQQQPPVAELQWQQSKQPDAAGAMADVGLDPMSKSLDGSENNDDELAGFGDIAGGGSNLLDSLAERRIQRHRRESQRDELENLGAAAGVGYYDHGDLGRDDPTRNREILYQSADYACRMPEEAVAAASPQRHQLLAGADSGAEDDFNSLADLQRSQSGSPTLLGAETTSDGGLFSAHMSAPESSTASSSASFYSEGCSSSSSSVCSEDEVLDQLEEEDQGEEEDESEDDFDDDSADCDDEERQGAAEGEGH